MRDWPPCPTIQRGGGRQSRPGVNPFISALTVARCPATFPGVWPQLRDILSTSRRVGRRTGASYTCRRSLKPARFLFIPIHKKSACFPDGESGAQTAPHPVFPVSHASRYNTLHFASKVVCQRGLRPPLETPTRKGSMLPLHGAHTAFSCYPALRLYRLSKSPRGIDVVSLSK